MSAPPKAVIIKFPGTNCDAETARALGIAGFSARVLPSALLDAHSLDDAQLVVFAGGFSYGDYVMSGRFAKLTTISRTGDGLRKFIGRGGYAMGICNGFQILIQLGLLPEGSLIHNRTGRFICRWVKLTKNGSSPYLDGLPDDFELPIAHAEGRFVASGDKAAEYVGNGRAALLYGENVNGSTHAIAGLQDETGRVFGLMPHPERFIYKQQHYDPDWNGDPKRGWGCLMFESLRGAMG